MFFFGLFSTHLPYIIVGLAYFASVAFASVHMVNRANKAEHDSKEQNTIVYNNSENLVQTTTYQILELSARVQAAIKPDGWNCLIPVIVIQTFTCQEPGEQGSIPDQYFARPPPAKC